MWRERLINEILEKRNKNFENYPESVQIMKREQEEYFQDYLLSRKINITKEKLTPKIFMKWIFPITYRLRKEKGLQ